MQIEILDGATAAPIIESHYHRNDFLHLKIRATEILFIATNGLPEVLGCVLFCIEEGTPLLRSMAVDESSRDPGLLKMNCMRRA